MASPCDRRNRPAPATVRRRKSPSPAATFSGRVPRRRGVRPAAPAPAACALDHGGRRGRRGGGGIGGGFCGGGERRRGNVIPGLTPGARRTCGARNVAEPRRRAGDLDNLAGADAVLIFGRQAVQFRRLGRLERGGDELFQLQVAAAAQSAAFAVPQHGPRVLLGDLADQARLGRSRVPCGWTPA